MLRDVNRSLQLQLRDVEVANDDFERQARNNTSSLEDIESKYDATLERNILLEEEVKMSEQEREHMRIEAQRLRDELTDLRIEAEVTHDKLRIAEVGSGRAPSRDPPSNSQTKIQELPPPHSKESLRSMSSCTGTTIIVPFSETWATKHEDDLTLSPSAPAAPIPDEVAIPPLNSGDRTTFAHAPTKARTNVYDTTIPLASGRSTTGKPGNGKPPVFSRRPPQQRNVKLGGGAREGLTRSGSLYQIRGLMGKMQKLEERVQSVRSKLPAPAASPASSHGETGEIDEVTPALRVRLSGGRRSEFGPSFQAHETDSATRRESQRPSRVSLGGRAKASSSEIGKGTSQSFNTAPAQSSVSGNPGTLLVSTLNQQPAPPIVSRPVPSLGRTTSQLDHDLGNDNGGGRKGLVIVRQTSRRTTLDDETAGPILHKSNIPFQAQASERNLRVSISGASHARTTRKKRSTNDDPDLA